MLEDETPSNERSDERVRGEQGRNNDARGKISQPAASSTGTARGPIYAASTICGIKAATEVD